MITISIQHLTKSLFNNIEKQYITILIQQYNNNILNNIILVLIQQLTKSLFNKMEKKYNNDTTI